MKKKVIIYIVFSVVVVISALTLFKTTKEEPKSPYSLIIVDFQKDSTSNNVKKLNEYKNIIIKEGGIIINASSHSPIIQIRCTKKELDRIFSSGKFIVDIPQ